MLSASIHTLGCKLNQLESEALADAFRREGFDLLPWGTGGQASGVTGACRAGSACLLLINTCTVTSMAEQKARRMIRKSLRENPEACLIVTGCYAQLEKAAIEELDPVSCNCPDGGGPGKRNPSSSQFIPLAPRRLFVVPGDVKSALLDLPRFLAESGAGSVPGAASLSSLIAAWVRSRDAAGTWDAPVAGARDIAGKPAAETVEAAGDGSAAEGAFRFIPGDFSSHSRGFLKIQDGCDKRCTYCRVTLARGPSLSLSAEKVLAGLKGLEEKGYGEAVLTGVNITQYRDRDAQPGQKREASLHDGRDLGGLLEYLLSGSGEIRIRLSSLEPEGLTGTLVQALAHRRIRPHFHLSVQSGSPFILERMGRSYSPDEVEQGAALLRGVKADPFLACDIITGFPGETTAEFEKTYELCRRIGFAWIHAFPYSRRPGTAAWSFKNPVSEREAARRVTALLNLAKQGRQEYIGRWIGKEVEAIAEGGNEKNAPLVQATSENYLKLLIVGSPGKAPPPGAPIHCRIKGPADPSGAVLMETGHFDATAEIVG
ncbi:tRNA (N(6)-L-threonylcarbamoyladenosine(37)-C(2))-methylthiotransferase MtaB [Spirochaetia bacterium]|nr:tRNA (N(6)-L-threonylcarbamoyladenosine(37)-C(2))-methylthiotransferase MtaB [Spirochaetia bacterium]